VIFTKGSDTECLTAGGLEGEKNRGAETIGSMSITGLGVYSACGGYTGRGGEEGGYDGVERWGHERGARGLGGEGL
jgi:hypothetical protein